MSFFIGCVIGSIAAVFTTAYLVRQFAAAGWEREACAHGAGKFIDDGDDVEFWWNDEIDKELPVQG